MKITNKLNLPSQFIQEEYHKPAENVYSVTELLKSTKEIILYRKYFDEVSVDVSDMVSTLFGTAVHNLLEKATTSDVETEYSIEVDFEGVKIKGRCDVVDFKNLVIEDYKTCSTSKKDYEDWKKQGLLYALIIYLTKSIKIKKLRFYALMKDWSKVKAASNSSYPQNPIYIWEYDIEDSDYMYIMSWLRDKIEDIKNGIHDCSDEEKWYTGTKYAVYKNAGDKRAAYVTDNEKDAHNYINNKLDGVGEIEVRKGDNLKCLYYCNVSKFCEKGGN